MHNKFGPDGSTGTFLDRVDQLSPEDAMPELRARFFELLAGESDGDVDEFIAFTLAVGGVESGTPQAVQTLVHMLAWSRRDILNYFAEFQLYQDPGGVELALAHAASMSPGEESDGDDDGSFLDTDWRPDAPDESWRSSL